MTFFTRSWHHFLQTSLGKVFLFMLCGVSALIALLAGIDILQLGTFEGWLTSITALCGLCYAIFHLFFTIKVNPQATPVDELELEASELSQQPQASGVLQKITASISDFGAGVFPVLLIVLLLRSFFFEPFRIPSGSMLPTLHLGDFILVNKYVYGVKLPVWGNTIIDMDKPQRGDIIVFRFPDDKSLDYIKRVVGIPGDTIQITDTQVSVNGQLLKADNQGIYEGKQQQYVGGLANQYFEHNIGMPEHLEYSILWDINGGSPFSYTYRVPQGGYFVLGDNRSNSNDSRYWGFVPENNIKGRASYIWLNWYDEMDFSRIGTSLK